MARQPACDDDCVRLQTHASGWQPNTCQVRPHCVFCKTTSQASWPIIDTHASKPLAHAVTLKEKVVGTSRAGPTCDHVRETPRPGDTCSITQCSEADKDKCATALHSSLHCHPHIPRFIPSGARNSLSRCISPPACPTPCQQELSQHGTYEHEQVNADTYTSCGNTHDVSVSQVVGSKQQYGYLTKVETAEHYEQSCTTGPATPRGVADKCVAVTQVSHPPQAYPMSSCGTSTCVPA